MNRHHNAMRLIGEARPPALDEAPDRPVPLFPDEPAPVRHARRVSRRLVLAGLLPTVAAGLVAGAVVVAVANRPGGSAATARPAESATPARPVTARGILLAAADKAAAVAPATGGYWVTKVELDNTYDVGGYHVLGRSEVETWQPLGNSGGLVYVVRSLGAAPATVADKAAWQAADSPTKWILTGPEGKQSHGRGLSAEPGPRKVSTTSDGGFLAVGGTPLTYAQIRALPTDPGKLKAYLIKLDDAAGRDGAWTPEQIEKWRVEMLFTESWELLSQLPVAPSVRAATYRMPADLPGLTVTENVRDAKGRPGVGIGYTYRNSDGTSAPTRLVIDPNSGSLLAREDKAGSSLLLAAGFSDATPPRS
jgi:hypothetical protein